MQAILFAQRTKYLGGHAGVSMMRPVEDLRLDQRFREDLRKPFARRIGVFSKVRMMNETFAADFQLRSKLAQVHFDYVPVRMHERIETEHEIQRRIGNHRQRAAVIQDAANMRNARKTLLTRFDALVRFINRPQFVAVILQIMRPPPEPGGNFQNRIRRQTLANARKNRAGPLRARAAPRFRPFLARLFPVVLHRIKNRFMVSKTDLNHSRPQCNDGRIHIAMLKKKTDAKSFNKAINKHALDAPHLATALAAATATYSGAAERTQLKMANTIPDGKEILRAVSSNTSSLKRNRDEIKRPQQRTHHAKA